LIPAPFVLGAREVARRARGHARGRARQRRHASQRVILALALGGAGVGCSALWGFEEARLGDDSTDDASSDVPISIPDVGTPDRDPPIAEYGAVDSTPPTKSCVGLAATCGPGDNADCCASSVVPGGTFNRGNDASYPATVSTFRLDTYEITVGRFRTFVAAYARGVIPPGAGKLPATRVILAGTRRGTRACPPIAAASACTMTLQSC
jgi:hypothetical protein